MRFSFLLSCLFVILLACNPSNSSVASAENTTAAETVADQSPVAEQAEISGDPTLAELDKKYAALDKAYFAGGCFWCTEAAFDRINGVKDVWSGYTGGPEENPTYEQVSMGRTRHAEAVVVYFDPAIVSYETLLDVFFVAHDPTQLNRQGNDIGPQYRSGIYFLTPSQEAAANAKISELEQSGKFSRPIVTEVVAANAFYLAEGYHQDYYEDPTNPNQSYVRNVSKPKVEKVMKVFADMLKPEFKKKP